MTGSDATRAGGTKSAHVLRWGGAVAIAGIAIIRCVVLFGPQIAFDVDPAVDPLRFAGLGPAASLMLDVLLLLAAAAGLLGERLAGRGVDWWLVGLAALPVPAVVMHGVGDMGQMWRGSLWIAAAAAAVSAAHLSRDRAVRNALLAMLLATIAPLVMRAAVQAWHEHPQTVELFEQTKDRIFAEKGWERGSPAARIYERRLRQPQPSAWFISPNALATFAAVGLVTMAGLLAASRRGGMTSGWWGAAGVLALACAVCLWLTAARGAIGAAAVGLGFLVLPLLGPPGRRLARVGGWVAVALILLVPLGVLVRGVVLPEDFAGDRSLLFRWHYAESAARIIATHPLDGTGPDRFQEAYMTARNPRNPEEVTSAHSVYWDWLAMLGVGGIGWIALTLVLARRAAVIDGSELDPPPDTGDDTPPAPTPIMLAAVPVLACAAGYAVEMHVVAGVGALARVAAALVAAGLVLLLALILRAGDARVCRWAVAAGVVTLLVHAQIELTFYEAGAAPWAFVLLGVAGGARRGAPGGAVVAGALAVAAIALVVIGVGPASREQAAMRDAAGVLAPVGEARWNMQVAMQTQDPAEFRAALAISRRALERMDVDPALIQRLELERTAEAAAPLNRQQVEGFFVLLAAVEVPRREEAAGILLEAADRAGVAPRLVDAAVSQLMVAARLDRERRPELLRRAADAADAALEHDERPRLVVSAISANVALAATTGDPDARTRALDLCERLTRIDPHGNETWKRLGDLAWLGGDRTTAIAAYRRALEADDQFELDPLAQFPEPDRRMIEQRVAEAGGP